MALRCTHFPSLPTFYPLFHSLLCSSSFMFFSPLPLFHPFSSSFTFSPLSLLFLPVGLCTWGLEGIHRCQIHICSTGYLLSVGSNLWKLLHILELQKPGNAFNEHWAWWRSRKWDDVVRMVWCVREIAHVAHWTSTAASTLAMDRMWCSLWCWKNRGHAKTWITKHM